MDDATGVMPYDIFMLKGQIFPADDIDVVKIIEEIIGQRRYFPFKTEDGKQWLWCPTMPKNQIINHPSRSKYPAPPTALRECYRSGNIALPLSRIELSRVELNKPSQPYWAGYDINIQEQMKEITKDFNIYQFLGKLKKDKKIIEVPSEVINRVCTSWEKNKAGVKDKWPWFIKAISREWESWNAEQNIRKHQIIKEAPIPKTIQQIIAGMGK
jgi:hypothetical protein